MFFLNISQRVNDGRVSDMHILTFCELKAAQSAMFLIRKYAVDKDSSDALLEWLKPFETLIYKREGNWRDLAAKNKLTKSIIPKSNSPYGQDFRVRTHSQ